MQSILKYFIKYHVAVNIIVLVFISFGIIGALSMSSSYHPLIDTKNISISVLYLGASPNEMEEGVVLKIENNLKETRFGTIRRYVEALDVNRMSLRLEFDDGNFETLQLI